MRYVLSVLLLLAAFASSAAVYMHVNKDGTVTYSDMPSAEAKRVDVPESRPAPPTPPAIKSSPPVSEKSASNSSDAEPALVEEDDTKKPYTTFLITSPLDQQTFQNQRDIPVVLKVEPQLQKGDKIQLILDGKPRGEALETTQLELKLLDRGTHQVQAVLLDEKQTSLKQSNSITIFVHYASVNTAALSSKALALSKTKSPLLIFFHDQHDAAPVLQTPS